MQELYVLWIELTVLVALAILHDFIDYGFEKGDGQLFAQTLFFLVEDGQQSHLPHLGQSQVPVNNVNILHDLFGVLG